MAVVIPSEPMPNILNVIKYFDSLLDVLLKKKKPTLCYLFFVSHFDPDGMLLTVSNETFIFSGVNDCAGKG